ncbi:11724_t:CDS:2, partial [Entrophospora sp. SA101]
NEEVPETLEEIRKNIRKLKAKLVKPVHQMVPTLLPIIQETCMEFVSWFIRQQVEVPPEKLKHNRTWYESEDDIIG